MRIYESSQSCMPAPARSHSSISNYYNNNKNNNNNNNNDNVTCILDVTFQPLRRAIKPNTREKTAPAAAYSNSATAEASTTRPFSHKTPYYAMQQCHQSIGPFRLTLHETKPRTTIVVDRKPSKEKGYPRNIGKYVPRQRFVNHCAAAG